MENAEAEEVNEAAECMDGAEFASGAFLTVEGEGEDCLEVRLEGFWRVGLAYCS